MFLKSDDAEILISGFGQGPRTLVAHGGFVGSGELWFPPFERLSKTWRTVTYDHRGTGATRHSAPAITFELLMADLFRVLDALNIDQCVLAAESMGAIIALEAVLRRPERFTGLVIVDGRYTGQRSRMRDKLIAGCRQDFSATMDGFVEACIPEQGCEAEKAWGKAIVMRSNAKAAIEMLECVEQVELEPQLNKIEIPTLILHGRKDVITPLASSEKLVQQIKNSSLVVHEDAGHVPTVTRPVWIAEQINQFFGQ